MIGIRPYKSADAETILSWCRDESSFYRWTAGVLGDYPVTAERFRFVEAHMPFTAFDEDGIVGFFTLRVPDVTKNELRFGFVILDPEKRGKGYGKAMMRRGLSFAFDAYGADRVSLGVFENNPGAYYCYKAAGFADVTLDAPETYRVLGEQWVCSEMAIERSNA